MSLVDDSVKPQRLSHDKSGSLKSPSGISEFLSHLGSRSTDSRDR
jgi:hypothetical protein